MEETFSNERATQIAGILLQSVGKNAKRNVFFEVLSQQLQKVFFFDRLCINLYDQQGQIITYFTAAKGKVVSTLSPIRPANISSTVAGHVISSRQPVIITDFSEFFPNTTIHPIAEAGLSSTIALPLELDGSIIGTIHCSFSEEPENIYTITSFLLLLVPAISACLGAVLGLEYLREETLMPDIVSAYSFSEQNLICNSPLMQELIREAATVAKLSIPVLIIGETGTGKSLLAEYIHQHSTRKEAKFVKINCPSLSESLFESELFGHVKGSFTGASRNRIGRLEMAHNGTLFLDEIAELSPEMQTKLLQVFDESSFERVGESIPLTVDIRLIAATNVKLNEALAAGLLRSDFYYRLSLFVLEIPPLRNRQEDIAPLSNFLADHIARNLGVPRLRFTPKLLHPFYEHDWPGNVRELRNIVSRLVVHNAIHKGINTDVVVETMKKNRKIMATSMEHILLKNSISSKNNLDLPSENERNTVLLSENITLAELERRHILAVLKSTGGVVSGPRGAANMLGMPRSTLLHRMKKLGID